MIVTKPVIRQATARFIVHESNRTSNTIMTNGCPTMDNRRAFVVLFMRDEENLLEYSDPGEN